MTEFYAKSFKFGENGDNYYPLPLLTKQEDIGKKWKYFDFLANGIGNTAIYNVNNIFISGNGSISKDGTTWNNLTGLLGMINHVVYFPSEKCYVACTNKGTYILPTNITPTSTWHKSSENTMSSMAIFNNSIIVGVNNTGIFYSESNSLSFDWTQSNITTGSFSDLQLDNNSCMARKKDDNTLYYSTDGKTWTQSNAPTNMLTSGSYFKSNNKIWILGDKSSVQPLYYSTDCKTWTQSNIANLRILGNITIVDISNDFFIVGKTNDGVINLYRSTNGNAWSEVAIGENVVINQYSSNIIEFIHSLLFVNTSSGTYCSNDGNIWTSISPSNIKLSNIVYTSNKFVATVESNKLYYSSNGTTWEQCSGDGLEISGQTLEIMAYNDKAIFVQSYNSISGYRINQIISVADSDNIIKSDNGEWVKADIQTSLATSVNGKTGNVTLTASDVGALPNTYKPIFTINITNIAADESVTADKTYTEVESAYKQGFSIYCLYNNNYVPLIQAPTDSNKAFGFVLTGVIRVDSGEFYGETVMFICDESGWANTGSVQFSIPTKTSQLTNDSGFLTSAPVIKVNNKTGNVELTASDVGALPKTGGLMTGAIGRKLSDNLAVYGASIDLFSGNYTNSPVGITFNREGSKVSDGITDSTYASGWILNGHKGIEINSTYKNAPAVYISGLVDPTNQTDAVNKLYVDQALVSKANISQLSGLKPFTVQNVSVAISAWVANTNSQATDQEKTDYPYMAIISPLVWQQSASYDVTEKDMATVLFNYNDQISGNFAPCVYTTTNGVIIEAKEIPSDIVTLSSITIEKVTQVT